MSSLCMQILSLLLLTGHSVRSDDKMPIPADKSQLSNWFNQNVGPITGREGSLDQALTSAENRVRVVKVRKDGTGDFRTVKDAIDSIPVQNKDRVIVSIGAGNYTEKITIEMNKPLITLYGEGTEMPTLVYGGTAAEYGTVDSATLTVESDYFIAVNLKIVNSAARPDGKRGGAQAAAFRISGNKASFYNCKFYGFQDTLCDDKGKHFFKDCYVQGTVDFIFGGGKSLYLNTEIHVVAGDAIAIITAQARGSNSEDSGFSFVHCTVTGTGNNAYLGRAWRPYARVVFAYSDFTQAVNPQGWSNNIQQQNNETVYFGEYKNKGSGLNSDKRAEFTKELSDKEATLFICLGFIEGSNWILPPPNL